jgi:hypothetical protein
MTVAGVCGVVGGGVLACKATLKAEKIMDKTQLDVEVIRESAYTDEKAYDRALTKVYMNCGKEIAKAYGPAILLGVFSISAILYGHKVVCARNIMLTGAYKALTMDFDAYRKRVAEEFGYDTEVCLRHNLAMEKRTNPETGVEEEWLYVTSDDPAAWNARSKFFCESSIYWTKDPEANMQFLLKVEEEMQKLFDKKGYLFLNTVYRELDIPETYAGSVCGWVKGLGDNRIDFGLFDRDREGIRRFVNGYEPTVLLDFNDDGYIADKI